MNIHKCNEAARWKAEVLQMMWAGAKDHAAGARARARQRTISPRDTICPGCHPLWRCHPFGGATPSGCHQQASDATNRHWMTLSWDITPLELPPSLDATNSHQTSPPWDMICPGCPPLRRCHLLGTPSPVIRCHPHRMPSASNATPFGGTTPLEMSPPWDATNSHWVPLP